jgi:hypothetical protein
MAHPVVGRDDPRARDARGKTRCGQGKVAPKQDQEKAHGARLYQGRGKSGSAFEPQGAGKEHPALA